MTSIQMPSRIAMPCPFANNGDRTEVESSVGSNVNYKDGFPQAYGAPTSNNGKFVTRKEMNGAFYASTADIFYHKAGGLNTFDVDFCIAVGGYPYGAVLQWVVDNNLFEVISLTDNNMVDFTGRTPTPSEQRQGIMAGTVDNINWAYANVNKGTLDTPSVFEADATTGAVEGTVSLGSFVASKSGRIRLLSGNYFSVGSTGSTGFAFSVTSGGAPMSKSGGNGIATIMTDVDTDTSYVIGASSQYGTWACTTSNSYSGQAVNGHKWTMSVSPSSLSTLPIVTKGNTYSVSILSRKIYEAGEFVGGTGISYHEFEYSIYASSGVLKLGIV